MLFAKPLMHLCSVYVGICWQCDGCDRACFMSSNRPVLRDFRAEKHSWYLTGSGIWFFLGKLNPPRSSPKARRHAISMWSGADNLCRGRRCSRLWHESSDTAPHWLHRGRFSEFSSPFLLPPLTVCKDRCEILLHVLLVRRAQLNVAEA